MFYRHYVMIWLKGELLDVLKLVLEGRPRRDHDADRLQGEAAHGDLIIGECGGIVDVRQDVLIRHTVLGLYE